MDKEQYIKFSDAQIGSTINRPVLVSAIAENTARNGNIFVKVSLKDGFSEVTAMMFDASQESLASLGIRQNTIADAELSVSEYQGSKSFKIVQIRPTADSTLTVNNFTKLPPVDLDLMYSEICSMIESSANDYDGNYTPLSDLALKILTKYKDSYMTSSAAISMHHNLRGGLLYHSYRMVKAADALCGVYTNLDRELLLCGTALHDIGKVWEYKDLYQR